MTVSSDCINGGLTAAALHEKEITRNCIVSALAIWSNVCCLTTHLLWSIANYGKSLHS